MSTDLDITFNSPNGFVTTDFGFGTQINYGRAIALQTDGKILMVGDINNGSIGVVGLARYNTDGSLDGTFGTGGLTTAQIASGNTITYGLTIQQNGYILVCGHVLVSSFENMFVARFTPSGSLDTTFNSIGYILITPALFNAAYPLLTFDRTFGTSVQIDTAYTPNRIVIGGYVRRTSNNRYYFALVRLDSTGSLDTTFGQSSSGLVAKNFDITKDEFGNSLAITTTGDYILGGSQQIISSTNSFAIAKFDTTGSPISSFGSSGLVVVTNFFTGSDDYGASLKIQQDGKFVLGGTSTQLPSGDTCYAVVRVDPTTGTLDSSFGTGGQVITDLSSQTPSINLTGNSVALQLNGKIVLGGTYSIPSTSVTSFSLARYNTDGTLDTTFGLAGNGLILEDLVSGTMQELGQSVAIQTDGKILLGGVMGEFSDISELQFFILARYIYTPVTPVPPVPPVPVVPICFPAGTPVLTDQGNIPIEKINPEVNTIGRQPIIAITKSLMNEDKIVCIEKNSLGINIPNKKTYISNYHGIIYNNKLIPAKQFVGRYKGIYYIKYENQILYNVLMEKHYAMVVNNMRVETLNPKNIVAKLYTNDYSDEEKTKLILEISENTNNNKYFQDYKTYNGYEKITNNVTRRNLSIFRYNPLITRLNFHTKKHFISHNSITRGNKYSVSYSRNNSMLKINSHTFRHGRRRR